MRGAWLQPRLVLEVPLDDPVGTRKQRRRYGKPELPGCLEVDRQLELGDLKNGDRERMQQPRSGSTCYFLRIGPSEGSCKTRCRAAALPRTARTSDLSSQFVAWSNPSDSSI